MVVNIGKVLSGDWEYVERDIRAVVDAAHAHGAIVKVIFENDFLPDDATKVRLCEICQRVGADFVKTSTGFGFVKQPSGDYNYRGATEHDVQLMREHTKPPVQVKAAGGVRDFAAADRMRQARRDAHRRERYRGDSGPGAGGATGGISSTRLIAWPAAKRVTRSLRRPRASPRRGRCCPSRARVVRL